MNEENIHQLLSLLSSDGMLVNEWVIAHCPFAFARHRGGKDNSPSFGIRHEPTGRSGYNCFSCGVKGPDLGSMLIELQYHVDKYPNAPAMQIAEAHKLVDKENEVGFSPTEWKGKKLKTPPFQEWPEWWLDSFGSVSKFPEAVVYLKTRNVSLELAKVFDLRYDTGRKMIGFPYRDGSGRMAGMRGRTLTEEGVHHDYRYNGVSNVGQVWLGEHHLDVTKPVVVVEGQFDYAAVYRVYRNVIANLTVSLSTAKMKKLRTAVAVIEMFDYDKPGRVASMELEEQLKGVAVHHFPYEKLVGMKDTDPGELTLKQLASGIGKFVRLDPVLK